ncbi:hypothetical protein SESBI_12983 [Sesbania bispinosa]|nr:hypothetical protein SESBI_12983 [Sesbania bispinosa]
MDMDFDNFPENNMGNNHISDNGQISHSNFHDVAQSTIVEEHNTEPHIGMEFDSLKKVVEFYKLFVKAKGFRIRTRSRKENYCILCWTKEANRSVGVSDVDSQKHDSDVLRSMHVQNQFDKFSDLAERSEDAYKFIMTELDHIYNIAATIAKESPVESSQHMCDTLYESNSNIKDPYISQTKGRRRKDSEKVPPVGRQHANRKHLNMSTVLTLRELMK